MNYQTGDSRSTPDPTQPGAATGAGAVAAAVTSAVESGVKVGNRQAATSKGTALPLSPPRVTIVVPAYNQAEMTEKCLYALAANTGDEPDYRVVVVDNGSTDWTMYLLHAMEGDIEVISNDTNLGFAEACNQGAEWAQASDYLLFLNNDTEPRQRWLEAMVDLADSDPNIGIVGAKLLYPGTGRVQHAGLVMLGGTPEHIYRGVDQNDPRVLVERDLDMVTGACLLVRREIFAELGGFDSEYINGVEDVDFCLRQRARWRVVYCPDAVLEHHEGSSEGRFDHVSENLNRFRQKWRGRFGEDGTLTVREEATIRSPLDDGSIGSGASPAQQGASTSEAGEASRGEAMAREYRRSSAMPTPRRSDVVQLSGGTPDVAELANIAKASETANPRLEGIRQKVESGYYNTQEALDQVAGAVIDSGRVTDVAAEVVQTQSAIEQLANVPDVREDRVNEVTERLSTQGSAFYDTPEVRSATADGFLDEIA